MQMSHRWRDENMPKRRCDICGNDKDVFGGKVCPNGHFTCHGCYYKHGLKCKICGKQVS